jgi:NDP-sugar pyrophosphorylase family protein
MKKRAVILAGGKGTRLRPYTIALPKPLVPLGDTPILEIVVRQLARLGFDHITMAVNHQAEIIRAFFQDGAKWNIRIDYSQENEPLGTMGPLRLIDGLPDNFLVMNGDILTDLDFADFLGKHTQSGCFFTISCHMRTHQIDYGVLEVKNDGEVRAFREKPSMDYLVSMGVYCLNRRVLENVPGGRLYGFDDLMKDMLARGSSVQTSRHDGLWLDIGRPDDYALANEVFEVQRSRLLGV